MKTEIRKREENEGEKRKKYLFGIKKKRRFLSLAILFFSLFLIGSVFAAESHEGSLEMGKNLVESGISCDELTDDNFEMIGEYYMELMHPGELHEIMDARLGGEGSESLRQAHINIGKMQYCGEYAGMQGYGWMMGGMGSGMMYDLKDVDYSNYGMYSYKKSFWNNWLGKFIGVFIIVALVLLIVLLYKKINQGSKR